MSTARKPNPAVAKSDDAVAMLTADHLKVKSLFEQFAQLKSEDDAYDQKAALVLRICQELTVHAQLEEELFYPAVRDAIDDQDLMDEATVEHDCAKELIAQLQEMEPEDDLFDAKVTVLGEQIRHHIKEEEDEMFVKAKKAKLDTAALGEDMASRRKELMSELPHRFDASAEASSAKSQSMKRSSEKRTG